MSPVAHFLGSWLIASATTTNARDRKLVTLAGIIPDADGLGLIADVAVALATGRENTFHYYQKYHHELLHGWPGALIVAGLLACFAQQRWRVASLCLLTFHLHLICDLIGSRGPSPWDLWPISYGEPLFRQPVFFWRRQWRLDGWQNRIVCITVFLSELWLAPRRGYSCLQVVSRKADRAVVAVLQKWRLELSRYLGTG
jgi:hypothetical protein